MGSHDTHRAVYRSLVRLYPRGFRRDYGDDLQDLFADQLRDEPAARVWARTVVDLGMSVLRLHLEENMKQVPKAGFFVLAAVVVLFTPSFLRAVAALILFGVWRAVSAVEPLPWLTPSRMVAVGLVGGAVCLAIGLGPTGVVGLREDVAWRIGFLGVVGGPGLALVGLLRGALHARRGRHLAAG